MNCMKCTINKNLEKYLTSDSKWVWESLSTLLLLRKEYFSSPTCILTYFKLSFFTIQQGGHGNFDQTRLEAKIAWELNQAESIILKTPGGLPSYFTPSGNPRMAKPVLSTLRDSPLCHIYLRLQWQSLSLLLLRYLTPKGLRSVTFGFLSR